MKEIVRKERHSSLELLRIISMLLIVAAHFSVHGEYPKPTFETFGINYVILQILGSFAYVGVEAFMLITGYFLVMSLKNNYRKAIKMVSDILFYSVILLAVVWMFNLMPLTTTDILGSFSPWGYYWFVTNYVIVLLLASYINQILIKLSRKQYLALLLIVGIATRVLPIMLFGHISITTGTIDYFILFYLIGGFIRLHVPETQRNVRWLILSMAMFLLVVSILLTLDYIALRMGKEELLGEVHYLGLDTLPVDVCAIALFLYFRNLAWRNRVINEVARYTLDVYLIHENRLIMKVLWGGVLSNAIIYNKWFVVYAVLEIVAVYVICTMIGWCKQRTWDIFFGKLLDKCECRYNDVQQ